MTNNFIQHRQKAIDWLNGKRDFDAGIKVLEDSKFKPGVVAKLKRVGIKAPEAKSRLVYLMRSLVQAWAMNDEEVVDNTDPATGLDEDSATIVTDSSAAYIQMAAEKLESEPNAFPERISSVIREYASAYKTRDKLHKQLAELPENNEPDVMEKRQELTKLIAEKTDLMEKLYPLYEKYLSLNEDISEEELKQLEHDDDNSTNADASENEGGVESDNSYVGKSKQELQKLRKSISTKIGRAKNMLEYQQETKKDTPDPMPESPKRVKYETKIANLTAELEQIDYAIAKLA
ncbi:MAG: hypothetical protein IKB31_02840 [Bacteroidaceae bacterium]|nr:hypothetical protein [Bacteroidaceae bacterium]